MKVLTTMGSKRNKGKRGFTLIELLIVMVILAILAGVVVMAVGGVFGQAKEQAYNTIKPQLQNAVTAYMVDNLGELPPRNDSANTSFTIATEMGNVSVWVFDICSIIGTGELIRTVPDGCYTGGSPLGSAPGNNFQGGCTGPTPGGSYIWVVDIGGNVYSVCAGADCQVHDTDGWQEIWP